jgi:hypothetical protein
MGLTVVMHNYDRDVVLARERLERGTSVVVFLIGVALAARGLAELRHGIDHDQARVLGRLNPVLDIG